MRKRGFTETAVEAGALSRLEVIRWLIGDCGRRILRAL